MVWPLLWVCSAIASPTREVWVQASNVRDLSRPGVDFAEGQDGDWWRVTVTADALVRLEADGFAWRPVPAPPPSLPPGYLNPEDMVDALEAIVGEHPNMTRTITLGESHQGRPIVALVISAAEIPRAQWRILGAHHGDELPSGEVVLDLARSLVDAYGSDPALTALIEQDAVWLVPHVNPDGVDTVRRVNANGVDLNRNYGHEWRSTSLNPGLTPFSEPESRAIRSLTAWNPFVAGLSYHAGATNIGWTWNWTLDESRDEPLLQDIAERYAELCTTPGFWSTNGAEWYVTHGDTTDWSLARYGTLDFTVELSINKAPIIEETAVIIEEHRDAALDFLLLPELFFGEVVDAATGEGIPARIALGELGEPLQTGPLGRFARPTPAFSEASLSVTVSAPGYASASVRLDRNTDNRIALRPTDQFTLVHSHALLSRGGDGRFPLRADAVTLLRPGETPVTAVSVGEDQWQIDPGALAPGAWDLQTESGVAPRAVFVGELDDRVRITDVRIDGDTIRVSGDGFGDGSAAYLVQGPARSYRPLPTMTDGPDAVRVDVSALSSRGSGDDLVLWTNGYQLTVLDVFGAIRFDQTAPPREGLPDTQEPSDPKQQEPVEPAGCAAHRGPHGSGWWMPLALLAATRRRR